MHKVIIMGAGGRDFHDFNVVFRDDPETEVVAFTARRSRASTIAVIHRRSRATATRSASRSGPRPMLAWLVDMYDADEVVLAYSDLSHER